MIRETAKTFGLITQDNLFRGIIFTTSNSVYNLPSLILLPYGVCILESRMQPVNM